MPVMTNTTASPHAQLRGVGIGDVRWLPGFWGDRFEQCRTVTLPHLWNLADDPGAGHALTNLRIAAGERDGEFAGTHWQDEWVYKWIEAASYVYAVTRDAWLDARMDEAIDVIARAQEPDGYVATQTQVRGWPRYEKHQHHEVYVMGHLLSAACVHHRATGKTTFLDVARKVADYLYATFRPPRPPDLEHKIFNPSQIMGLAELYRATGEPRYLEAAAHFVDYHGATPGGSDQMQDRVPLREESQVVGHMVLSTYLYAGATDAYMETGDETLRAAMERLWDDLTQRRIYVHGGVATVHRGFSVRPRQVIQERSAVKELPPAPPTTPGGYWGSLVHRHLDDVHEAAGDDFELPNSTGYNETCAQIGNVLWNWRLLAATAQARHAELIEHTLYNSVISGIGLDGRSWFYTNPLRFHGKDHKLLSQDAYERFQPGRQHVCCPSNLARAVAGAHGFAYSLSGDGLWVNLYGASRFDGTLPVQPGGAHFTVRQETDYPWDGHVRFTVEAAPDAEVALRLRVPSWARGATLRLNGQDAGVPVEPETYARLARRWSAGDVVELDLPMRVRLVEGHPRIESTRNQVTVMRGPLVYCLEAHDLPQGVALTEVHVSPRTEWRPRRVTLDLRAAPLPEGKGGETAPTAEAVSDAMPLSSVVVLEAVADVVREPAWGGRLYRDLEPVAPERLPVRLIPYYAWANRGTAEMAVWLPLSSR
jgi:uncharacterized protein